MGSARPTVLLHSWTLPGGSGRRRASVDRFGMQGRTASQAQPGSGLCGPPPAVLAYGLWLALWEGFPLWRLRYASASREPRLQGFGRRTTPERSEATLECDHGRGLPLRHCQFAT